MSSVNRVILVGNLGSAPEIKTFENGNSMASFSLATSDRYKNAQGEMIQETEWHKIVLFGKKVELAEKYLDKGSKIYIEGKLKTRSWVDQDGNQRYATEISVDQMTFLSTKQEAQAGII